MADDKLQPQGGPAEPWPKIGDEPTPDPSDPGDPGDFESDLEFRDPFASGESPNRRFR